MIEKTQTNQWSLKKKHVCSTTQVKASWNSQVKVDRNSKGIPTQTRSGAQNKPRKQEVGKSVGGHIFSTSYQIEKF